jgi:speckle-type POZ protein
MGGTTSTRRVEVMAENCWYDGDLIPKTSLGSHVHVLEISGYSLHRERLRECDSLRSAVFTVGGYDWQIQFFPCGVLGYFKDYVAAYLFFKSKNKNIRGMRASFQFSLVDGTGSMLPYTIPRTTYKFDSGSNMWCGHHDFMKRSDLEVSPYLHDDRLTIECAITIVRDVESLPKVPPSARPTS